MKEKRKRNKNGQRSNAHAYNPHNRTLNHSIQKKNNNNKIIIILCPTTIIK